MVGPLISSRIGPCSGSEKRRSKSPASKKHREASKFEKRLLLNKDKHFALFSLFQPTSNSSSRLFLTQPLIVPEYMFSIPPVTGCIQPNPIGSNVRLEAAAHKHENCYARGSSHLIFGKKKRKRGGQGLSPEESRQRANKVCTPQVTDRCPPCKDSSTLHSFHAYRKMPGLKLKYLFLSSCKPSTSCKSMKLEKSISDIYNTVVRC